MAAQKGHDPGYIALSRHLYWALDPGSRQATGTRDIRERLMAFSWRLRIDEELSIPMGEPYLTSPRRWRRLWKYSLFRVNRFAFRRYDRLMADTADLVVALSDRVVELETEADHLRERVSALEGKTER